MKIKRKISILCFIVPLILNCLITNVSASEIDISEENDNVLIDLKEESNMPITFASPSWNLVGTYYENPWVRKVYYYKESGVCYPQKTLKFYDGYLYNAKEKGEYYYKESVKYDYVYVRENYNCGKLLSTQYLVSWLGASGYRRYMEVTDKNNVTGEVKRYSICK